MRWLLRVVPTNLLPMALLPIAVAGLLGACGGDFEAAYADVTFVPAEPDQEMGQLPPREEPAPVVAGDPSTPPEGDPSQPEEPSSPAEPDPPEEPDPTVKPDPPAQPDPPQGPDAPSYDPPWTEHEDPAVEGCLEAFPAICNKMDECAADMPLLGLLSGLCPMAFDLASPLLTMGCEQVADLLNQALPDMSIPFVGSDLPALITDLLTGCIENFDCDPASVIELGQKLWELIQAAGGLEALTGGAGGGGSGGGTDLVAMLPLLLDVVDMCGGMDLLPFPF